MEFGGFLMWNLAYFIGVVVRKNTKILPAIVTTSHSFVQSYKSMIPTENYYIHFETLWKKATTILNADGVDKQRQETTHQALLDFAKDIAT